MIAAPVASVTLSGRRWQPATLIPGPNDFDRSAAPCRPTDWRAMSCGSMRVPGAAAQLLRLTSKKGDPIGHPSGGRAVLRRSETRPMYPHQPGDGVPHLARLFQRGILPAPLNGPLSDLAQLIFRIRSTAWPPRYQHRR